jgi:uncharacterized protein (TIRG00374 family)
MGNALRVGILNSRGASVLLTADDLPFGFDDLDAADRMSRNVSLLPQVIIGSKAHPESEVNRGWLRSSFTRGFGIMRRVILGMRTGDPQGTILINGHLARRLAGITVETGFLFTTELIAATERLGLESVEVPVRLSADHAGHASRVSWADVLAMAFGLLRIRRGRDRIVPQGPVPQAPGAGVIRGPVRFAVGSALSALFLFLTLWRTDLGQAWSTLTSLSALPLAGALLVCLIEVGVRAVRWRFLLAAAAPVTLVNSYLYICIGHFANAVLPFRLGDGARAYLAGGKFGAARMTVLGTIVVERLADGFTLLAIVVLGVTFGVALSPGSVVMAVGIGAAALAVAVAVFVLRPSFAGWVSAHAPRFFPHLRAFGNAFHVAREPRTLAAVVVTTVASFGASVLILNLVLAATGSTLAWWQIATAIGVMTLSTAIPAAPGAIGTYEFAGTSALIAFGLPYQAALPAVIAVHLLATIPPALIGVAATLVLHIDVLGLRNSDAGALSPQAPMKAEPG